MASILRSRTTGALIYRQRGGLADSPNGEAKHIAAICTERTTGSNPAPISLRHIANTGAGPLTERHSARHWFEPMISARMVRSCQLKITVARVRSCGGRGTRICECHRFAAFDMLPADFEAAFPSAPPLGAIAGKLLSHRARSSVRTMDRRPIFRAAKLPSLIAA